MFYVYWKRGQNRTEGSEELNFEAKSGSLLEELLRLAK